MPAGRSAIARAPGWRNRYRELRELRNYGDSLLNAPYSGQRGQSPFIRKGEKEAKRGQYRMALT